MPCIARHCLKNRTKQCLKNNFRKTQFFGFSEVVIDTLFCCICKEKLIQLLQLSRIIINSCEIGVHATVDRVNLVLIVCSKSWTTLTKNFIQPRIRHAEIAESDVLSGDDVNIKEDRFDR